MTDSVALNVKRRCESIDPHPVLRISSPLKREKGISDVLEFGESGVNSCSFKLYSNERRRYLCLSKKQ